MVWIGSKLSRPFRFQAHKSLLGGLWVFTILGSHVLWIPPYLRDDMIYHLWVPKQIALAGKLTFDPFNVNSNFPMLFEMPLVAWQKLSISLSPFIINLGFSLLLLVLMYSGLLCFSKCSKNQALALAFAFSTTPVLYDLLHSCYVEIFFTLLIALATLEYFRHLDGTGSRFSWWSVSAILGMAAAVKYPGCLFALIFFAFEFFRTRDRKTYYLGLTLFLFIASPWYIKSWIWTGNPVFPFLNTLFDSPWISAGRFAGYHHMLVDYHMGRAWSDYLLLPFRLALGMDESVGPGSLGFDGKLSLLFGVACLGLGIKDSKQKFFTILFLFYFAVWALESQQSRFLLPLIPGALILGLRRTEFFPKRALWIWALVALVLVQNALHIVQKGRKENILSLLSGEMDRETFLSSSMPVSYAWAESINRDLDPKLHKLMTVGGFGRNYYFNIPVLTNTFYDQEIFRNAFQKEKLKPDSVTAFFQRHHVTHLLFNWDYLYKMHVQDQEFDKKALAKFVEKDFQMLEQRGDWILYRWNPKH